MSSHIQDDIRRKMDYLAILDRGKIIEFGEAS